MMYLWEIYKLFTVLWNCNVCFHRSVLVFCYWSHANGVQYFTIQRFYSGHVLKCIFREYRNIQGALHLAVTSCAPVLYFNAEF